MDAEKLWYLDLSAGQAAAATRGLSCDFDVIHPQLGAAPAASGNRRSWAWRVAVVCFYAIIIAIGASVGLVVVAARGP
jgi:hypothetical protein